MQDWAKEFYYSKAWRITRQSIIDRDNGLCVKCGNLGEIVHHKIFLSPENINDTSITLNPDNLELLCRDCHKLHIVKSPPIAEGLQFDECGNVVRKEWIS